MGGTWDLPSPSSENTVTGGQGDAGRRAPTGPADPASADLKPGNYAGKKCPHNWDVWRFTLESEWDK